MTGRPEEKSCVVTAGGDCENEYNGYDAIGHRDDDALGMAVGANMLAAMNDAAAATTATASADDGAAAAAADGDGEPGEDTVRRQRRISRAQYLGAASEILGL